MRWHSYAPLIVAIFLASAPHSIAQQPQSNTTEHAPDAKSEIIVINGVVRDLTDQPVGGATVSAVLVSHRPKSDPLCGTTITSEIAHAKTAADGKFQLTAPKLTSGVIALELSASAPGSGIALQDLPIDARSHNVTLKLPKETRLRARLLDPAGNAIAKATIKTFRLQPVPTAAGESDWFSSPLTHAASWPPDAVTDTNGNFELTAADSIAAIMVELDDERAARQQWTIPNTAANGPLILHAAQPRLAEGEVVNTKTREPIPNVDVVISSSSADTFVGQIATKTDVKGHFSVRVYVGDQITINANLPNSKFQKLSRHIPWLTGTTTQHMVLPLYPNGTKAQDGTTPDGRQATTIETEVPTAEVKTTQPTKPLTAKFPGSIVAGQIPFEVGDSSSRIVTINLETGALRTILNDGDAPRVSADGKQILYLSGDSRDQVRVAAIDDLQKPRDVLTKCLDPAIWNGDHSCVINRNDPHPQDYFGADYWPLEFTKCSIDLNKGETTKKPIPIDAPLPYHAFDVSRDNKLLGMHWDTHCSATGAQLFVCATDGSQLRPIARRRSQYYWLPRFSPDGKFVVAKHLDAKSGELSIRVIALDGTEERSIILDKAVGPEVACWSPDGAYIAIVAYDQAAFAGGRKRSHVFIVDAAGDQIRELPSDKLHNCQITSIDWPAHLAESSTPAP